MITNFYKYILLIFIIFNSTEASIIKKVEFYETTDSTLEIDDIKNSNFFQKTTLPMVKSTENNLFFKITIDKKEIKDQDYILELLEFDNKFNEIKLDANIKSGEFHLTKYIILYKHNIPDSIYLKIINNEDFIDFGIQVYDKKKYLEVINKLSQLFGISYGIIFTSFLFYFAFFIFNKEKMYIYYAISQLSILIILVKSSYKMDINSEFYFEFVFLLFLITFTLFSREFLNTKKNMPLIDKLFLISIAIFILEFFTINSFDIYPIVPSTGLLSIYLIAGIMSLIKGQKEALFYLIGWGIVILSLLIIDNHSSFGTVGLINPIYLIHLSSPLESLILAFALSYKMKLITQEKEHQKELVLHQNKLASMGEMLANISHQWRQPLTHLSYIFMNFEARFEKDKLTKEYFRKKTIEANKQLEYMSNTIDNFKNFFKGTKQKETFSLIKLSQESIDLLQMTFQDKNIDIKVLFTEDIQINSYKGELMQVLFNLLNNAKDQFILKKISTPSITIKIIELQSKINITISDNAGGIDKKLINKIFEPYFTTKEDGLGIGLYMSKMIIEKSLNGKLEIQNIQDGVEFTLVLDK